MDTTTQQALLAQEAKVHQEADEVIAATGIMDLLSEYGELILEGGYRYGTMVDRDVDVRVILPRGIPSIQLRNEVMNRLLQLKQLCRIRMADLVNYTIPGERNATGIWNGAQFLHDSKLWNIDIWILDVEQGHQGMSIYDRMLDLSPEQRAIMLSLKTYASAHNRKLTGFASVNIYQAVLEQNVTDLESYLQSPYSQKHSVNYG